MRRLPDAPHVVIPGNHDLSLTSLVDRAMKPFKRFRRYITDDLAPFYNDAEVAIAGINTVRRSTVNNGKIKRKQARVACQQLGTAGKNMARIVVTHHPIDVRAGEKKRKLVQRSKPAMKTFVGCGVDLFLSGHLHTGRSIATSARYRIKGYSAVVVHAGTAASTRRRGEPNSWNVVRVDGVDAESGSIEVERMVWDGAAFRAAATERFAKGKDGWAVLEGEDADG